MSTIIYKGKPYQRADLSAMSASALVEFHNKLAAKPTKRFATRTAGVERTWKLLEAHGEKAKAAAAASAQPKVQAQVQKAARAARPAASTKPRSRRGTNLLPTGEPVEACRAGSKQAILVDKLSEKGGASMAELLDALSGGRKPWIEATVRSGFGWDLKRKGYGVRSKFLPDGSERFYLLVPEGERIPGHIGASASKPTPKTKAPAKLVSKKPAPRVIHLTEREVFGQVAASK